MSPQQQRHVSSFGQSWGEVSEIFKLNVRYFEMQQRCPKPVFPKGGRDQRASC